MKKIISFLLLIVFCSVNLIAGDKNLLIKEIQKQIEEMKADVSCYSQCDGIEIGINYDVQMPLFSVYKVFIAWSFLKKLEKDGDSIEKVLKIPYSKLQKDTYSPLLKEYGDDFEISAGELIKHSICLSDNNASDLLLEYCGGVKQVQKDLKKAKIKGISVTSSEDEMHKDFKKCYGNSGSVKAVCKFYEKLVDGKLLGKNMTDFFINTLYETSTGSNKIKGGLGKIDFAHKTGSGFRLEGKFLGDNDSGFFKQDDGKICYIAVFIRDSYETNERNAEFMSFFGKSVLNFLKN